MLKPAASSIALNQDQTSWRQRQAISLAVSQCFTLDRKDPSGVGLAAVALVLETSPRVLASSGAKPSACRPMARAPSSALSPTSKGMPYGLAPRVALDVVRPLPLDLRGVSAGEARHIRQEALPLLVPGLIVQDHGEVADGLREVVRHLAGRVDRLVGEPSRNQGGFVDARPPSGPGKGCEPLFSVQFSR